MSSLDHCLERVFKCYVENSNYMREELFIKLFVDHHLDDDDDLEIDEIRQIFQQLSSNPKGLGLSEFKEAVKVSAKKKGVDIKVFQGILNTCRAKKNFEYGKYINE